MSRPASYSLAPKRRTCFRCFICPLIGAMLVLAFVRVKQLSRNDQPAVAIPVDFSVQSHRAPQPAADIDAADTLLADVYPSRQSAFRALALRLPEAVARIN